MELKHIAFVVALTCLALAFYVVPIYGIRPLFNPWSQEVLNMFYASGIMMGLVLMNFVAFASVKLGDWLEWEFEKRRPEVNRYC